MKSMPQIVIERKTGWRSIDWSDLRRYEDLLFFLVLRNIKVLYKQTVLGFTWAIIRPVFSMIVFSVIFGRFVQLPSDGIPYPVFTYAALVPWTYFSTAMINSSQSLISHQSMVTKVYFPRIFIPLVPILSGLVDLVLALLVLGLLMLWYELIPPVSIVVLPGLIILMMITATGVGLWLSALAIRFRDVMHGLQFLAQLLMYAAPVVWPASLIPAPYRLIYGLYPMVGVIEGFRSVLIGAQPMPWDLLFIGSFSALLLAFSGTVYFCHMETTFADVA